MAKLPADGYELTDAEKRDLIKMIEVGQPLPEKYRFVLFADKREVELVWNGKTREVSTAILPFQSLEHVDEPRKEKHEEQELALDMSGRQIKGWTNKLIWGDNKLVLSSLKGGALRRQIEDAGGLKLIYIDPPFDVGADFSMDIEIGGETFHKEANLLEQIAYRDTWGRGADSFIAMLFERLLLMYDLLADDGSVFISQCDIPAHTAGTLDKELDGAVSFWLLCVIGLRIMQSLYRVEPFLLQVQHLSGCHQDFDTWSSVQYRCEQFRPVQQVLEVVQQQQQRFLL